MNASNCRQVMLAQNELAQVQRCTECGGITIHIGPMSVRLEERALSRLLSVLGEATVQLAAFPSHPRSEPKRGLA